MSAAMANHARIHPSNSPAAGTCLTLSCACQVVGGGGSLNNPLTSRWKCNRNWMSQQDETAE